MKSPLRLFRGLKLGRQEAQEEKQQHRPPMNMDKLIQATQDMQDMRSCCDSILSAAATTANNAHEFSEALEELGTCLLKKTALNDDEDSGRALMMMGKAQFALQKFFDVYRLDILRTMDKPSRSLLREFEVVEELKRLCDNKREIYKNMLAAHRVKVRSKHSKSETISSKELQEAQANYEETAALFVFRSKTLKKNQFQSLLKQATSHHAAQLSFFRKGLKTLEMVESYVRAVAEQHHIDYQFSDLEYVGFDYDDDGDDGGDDGGELSFDYRKKIPEKNVIYTSRNSIEESPDKSQLDMHWRPGYCCQSAPIFAVRKPDSAEKIGKSSLSTRKFCSYVLPTPVEDRTPESSPSTVPYLETKGSWSTPLWHSSPLEAKNTVKDFKESELPNPTKSLKNSILRESNIYSGPISMPSYFSEKLSVPQYNQQTAFSMNNLKRQAFSGPLTSKPFSSKPIFPAPDCRPVEFPSELSSTPHQMLKPQSYVSRKVSPKTSSPPVSSLKISELHELPRPPVDSEKTTGLSNLVGYSGPLVSKSQVLAARRNRPSDFSYKASPLPTPLGPMDRSFSISSNSQRIPIPTVARLYTEKDTCDAASLSPYIYLLAVSCNLPVHS
ncbi:hypothetical protein OPV22_019502 [Ensete ventricosum]|uniref:BAR domain-containing protein n=1 Tax=Ensete ventricosum TaxID=4639 RepID=A0AAV8P9D8_ENSVE|nr:hypothetical protein OPV22_019502 [Ensete ventricosum]